MNQPYREAARIDLDPCPQWVGLLKKRRCGQPSTHRHDGLHVCAKHACPECVATPTPESAKETP